MSNFLVPLINHGVPFGAGALSFYSPLNAARLIGSLLVLGGSVGMMTPVSFGVFFGIPWANEENTIFFPGIAARNLAAGITIWLLSSLSSLGRREQMLTTGIFVAVWSLAGWGDSYILLIWPGTENMFSHLRNIVMLYLISWNLLRRGQ